MASAKWSSPTVCWAPTNSQRGFAGSSAVRITSTYPFPGRWPDRALGHDDGEADVASRHRHQGAPRNTLPLGNDFELVLRTVKPATDLIHRRGVTLRFVVLQSTETTAGSAC